MDIKPCLSWLISCGDTSHVNSEIPRNNESYSTAIYFNLMIESGMPASQ
jgi:hypothetical protein